MLNNGSGKDSDGGFPMAFESEHVPELIQGFNKLQQKAIEKQTQLNERFELTQQQEDLAAAAQQSEALGPVGETAEESKE